MSLRDLLILIGVICIGAVFIGGFYRMRLAKKRATELHFGLEEIKGDIDTFGSELPNGGARKPGSTEHHASLDSSLSKDGRIEPDFSISYLDEEHEDSDVMDHHSMLEEQEKLSAKKTSKNKAQNKAINTASSVHKKAGLTQLNKNTKIKTEGDYMLHGLDNESKSLSKNTSPRFSNETSDHKKRTMTVADTNANTTEKLSDRPPAKEVIAINVITKGSQPFGGARLLQSLLNSGMRFGDMSIFHRYANDNGTGKIQFSMANGVEPGIFNIDNIDNTTTPAVSFFMGLPGPEDPIKAFTQMVETAKQLALDLGGELKDEQFSVITQQTIEHSRQRIIDYERKQLARRVSG
ncbi:MAG: cell division protein ZipA [Endozoicomonas sp. (ex Botrylloides leachii)]|nr:cell division protein ZipA [Endozoicomonas sp. (ex Botrylloides leachii)]